MEKAIDGWGPPCPQWFIPDGVGPCPVQQEHERNPLLIPESEFGADYSSPKYIEMKAASREYTERLYDWHCRREKAGAFAWPKHYAEMVMETMEAV